MPSKVQSQWRRHSVVFIVNLLLSYSLLLTYFTPCSGISIGNFEHAL